MNRSISATVIAGMLWLTFGSHNSYAQSSKAEAIISQWFDDFAIDRPWNELPNHSSSRKRHRGALVHIQQQLKKGNILAEVRAHLIKDLEHLLDLDKKSLDLMASKPAFNDCQVFLFVNAGLIPVRSPGKTGTL